ncbi:hypothetical protein TFKS16_2676 [Tannerella forsythia KS16]|uniref:Uncharacterized protein n=1 Tax=Tannerella forsythia (strain ATCC 43037 / JCM 10827 / CCUG 21028 A / KCTC 5666 / FDC 338) TaxID=203275 RepID=G8UPC1_TANFA|nr:hypothetical protein BFO_2956 [Tannerella forsythia 92A2]BAR50027.1 hypothetical protein TF3313_2598 [Tannerella forsythia 3313]BAR52854.1 hypothetical protein TFKS16_2676 [Tannerella forsythia KS16]
MIYQKQFAGDKSSHRFDEKQRYPSSHENRKAGKANTLNGLPSLPVS